MPAPHSDDRGKPADPCVMVIFGAAGDLTQRKLIPALYNLAKAELLPREFAIVGLARGAMSTEDFRKKVSDDIQHYAGKDVDPEHLGMVLAAHLLHDGRVRR